MKMLLLALVAMVLCLSVQIATILLAIRYFSTSARGTEPRGAPLAGFTRIASVMVLLMAGVIVQIAIWAGLYGLLDLFEKEETNSSDVIIDLGQLVAKDEMKTFMYKEHQEFMRVHRALKR